MIPYKLYDFQKRLLKDYNENRFVIMTKFRQAGLTTFTALYGLWSCMFKADQRILTVAETEAIGIGRIVKNAMLNLPFFMQPQMRIDNDHTKEFEMTGSSMTFMSPLACCDRAATHLIIDEAAFIKDMDNHWKALFPILSAGGKCFVISTPNGVGNWFEETYSYAKEGKNQFKVFYADYTEHPDYNHPEWTKQMRENLGEKGWLQEVMQSFLVESKPIPPKRRNRSEIIIEIKKLLDELDD